MSLADLKKQARRLAHRIASGRCIITHIGFDRATRTADYDLIVDALIFFADNYPAEKQFDPSNLEHGVYVINWKSGGSSVATVGSLHDGTRWFAPCNWTSQSVAGIGSTDWDKVESVTKFD